MSAFLIVPESNCHMSQEKPHSKAQLLYGPDVFKLARHQGEKSELSFTLRH